jgi:hypothetical protein
MAASMVVWKKFTDVSEVLTASIIRAIPEDSHLMKFEVLTAIKVSILATFCWSLFVGFSTFPLLSYEFYAILCLWHFVFGIC